MNSQDVKRANIPNFPGVYLFKKGGGILYIGKATSLKDRVKSYFSNDLLATRSPLILDMVFKADKIDFIKTDSVLEALILESELIKKHQPKYNTKEKDNKSFNYVIIIKEDFPRVLIVRGRGLEEARKKAQAQVLGFPPLLRNKCRPDHSSDQFSEPLLSTFGPFPNSAQLREALKIVRKIFPFRDKCLPNQGKACFNYQIGLCPGICIGRVSQAEYGKTIKNIKLFFQGKKKIILKNLEREMSILAEKHEFEKAGEVKKTIFALNHIQDVALIKGDKAGQKKAQAQVLGFPPLLRNKCRPDHSPDQFSDQPIRLEAYDVAHLSGTNTVGVMTVIENGEVDKDEYRKFKINKSTQNDIAGLQEILERRLAHKEWPYPQIIVVDGGKAQIKIAREILQKKSLEIPVVSVVKDKHHRPKAIMGDKIFSERYSDDILLANSEAHRFAISYHKNLRNKALLS